ncbi:MAG TPA: PfkB family carbohydrate kinase [Nitrososphaerales archaeon]|nr:PfkB family carbohydrate kinase [Nitrososphaerales archaeon]
MATETRGPALRAVVLGAINWDTTVFERDFASPGEEVPVLRVEEYPGGKGANAAVAVARILGRGSVAFLGALGSDQVKAPLLESLGAEGVRTDALVVVKGVSSGRAFIVVDMAGRKAIHTHFGANDALEPRHVQAPAALAALSSAPVTLIMDVPLPAALAAARAASRQSRIIYSPGVRASGPRELLAEVISTADDLVVDRSELARLSDTQDPRQGVEALVHRHPGVNVVATLGPEGCLVARQGTIAGVQPVDLSDLAMIAVNSTGSGDAFLAAYACYSLFGLPPDKAAEWGNLAGALKAASAETRGSPGRRALEEKMEVLMTLRSRRQGSR